MKFYCEDTEKVLQEVGSTSEGLSSAEAARRLEENGKNKLAEGKKESLIHRFFKQLAEPMTIILLVAAAISAGVEIFNRHGMLVTYYVRAKATEDSLTVHYIDDTAGANGLEFYSYNIAVKEGTYFKTGIALADPWKGNLVNGDVPNFYGRTQYVSADLQTLSQIGAQYLYTDYECVRVVRSDDGKHVYLYYTFNPTAYIVADFSLPLTIEAGMLSEALKDASITDMKFSGSDHTSYGKLTDNGSYVTYEPVKVLQGMDFFTLLVETSAADQVVEGAQGQVAFRVYVVPAPTVHYEETFFNVPEGAWTGKGTANAGSQETELASTKSVNYGFTTGYTAEGMSNGTEIVSSVTGNNATGDSNASVIRVTVIHN